MVGLCRLCASLRKADTLITIKDDNSGICEKLRHCCQLKITIDDALPKSICQECLEHLNMCHKFYLKVKEAQETLQTLYPSPTKELRKVAIESDTASLVKNLSIVEKDRRNMKLNLENKIKKVTGHKDYANKKTSDLLHPVRAIKLENNKDIQNEKCHLSESPSEQISPSKRQQNLETLNCLEEVCTMLDMTKEEVLLDNCYEGIETLDEANDPGEFVAEEVCGSTKYVDYENVNIQEDLTETYLLEYDHSEKTKDLSKHKTSVTNLPDINVEMEYIEDDECDKEVSSTRNDNKSNEIKPQTYLAPALQIKSWKSYSYLCYICDLKTPSFLELKKHIAAEHNITQSEVIQYKCYDCQKIIPRYNFFLNHIRLKHHPSLKLRCEACDLSCQTFEELSHHRRLNCDESINYENLLPCSQCFKSFYNTFGLQNHLRLQHTATKLHVKYQCAQCGKQLQNKNTFKAHQRMHTDCKIFVCDICQKTYYSKLSLEQHQHSHTSDKIYKCKICNKSFKTFITLDQHQSTHNDEKPFKCEYCEKNFRKKIEKISHERVHTGEMPFQCEQCDKRFRFRSAFNAHMKIHTGIKPYSCEYCDKTFAESSNRNKHVRRIHINREKIK